jgi:hypothetical protein
LPLIPTDGVNADSQVTESAAKGGDDAAPKRRRAAADDFQTWLSNTFVELEQEDGQAATDGGDDDTTNPPSSATGGSRRTNKRGRPMSEAAVAKAERERARRERLNEFFDELAGLCDPSGKASKGDRVSIVADAIRVVKQLRVENNQLRQLNKFFEERCGQLERSRAQAMYQQVAVHHRPGDVLSFHAQMQQHAAATVTAGVPSSHPHAVSQQQQFQQPEATVQNANLDAAQQVPALQHLLVSLPVDASVVGMQLPGLKHGQAATQGMLPTATNALAQPGAPAMAWLPAPDATEDQKLRPPAA